MSYSAELQAARRTQPVGDAVAACREEIEMEHVVTIMGGKEAQRAVQEHRLPDLVSAYMGPKPIHNGYGHA